MAEQTFLAPGIHHFSLELEEDLLGSFQGQWPVPHGLLSQTYGIKGQFSALVDWNPPLPEAEEVLKELLADAGFPWGSLDFFLFLKELPSQLSDLSRENPRARFLLPKGQREAALSSGVPQNRLILVSDGDHLDLGEGRLLRFITAEHPGKPESLLAWEESSGCLFTGEVFSGFGMVEDKYFWDQLSPQESDLMEEEAFRAFALRLSDQTVGIKMALEHIRTAAWPMNFLAPSFGLIHRRDFADALELWNRWLGYLDGKTEKEVTLLILPGCSPELENELVGGVISENVDLNIFRVPEDRPEEWQPSLLRSRGIIFAGKGEGLPLGPAVLSSRLVLTTESAAASVFPGVSWSPSDLGGLSPREAARNLAQRIKRGE